MRKFSIHGIPNVLISDDSKAFKSQEIQQQTLKNATKLIFTPLYHPSLNG